MIFSHLFIGKNCTKELESSHFAFEIIQKMISKEADSRVSLRYVIEEVTRTESHHHIIDNYGKSI